MIHLAVPYAISAALAGIGIYGVLARRNLVLVLVGVELVLAAGSLLLVTAGARDDSPLQTGQVLALFVITLAAAEIVVALGLVVAVFRLRGHVDVEALAEEDEP